MVRRDLDDVAVFDPINIQYLSNFYSIPTQRPIALLLGSKESCLIIPEMDVINLDRTMVFDQTETYYEYPQDRPMTLIGGSVPIPGWLTAASASIPMDHPGSEDSTDRHYRMLQMST